VRRQRVSLKERGVILLSRRNGDGEGSSRKHANEGTSNRREKEIGKKFPGERGTQNRKGENMRLSYTRGLVQQQKEEHIYKKSFSCLKMWIPEMGGAQGDLEDLIPGEG